MSRRHRHSIPPRAAQTVLRMLTMATALTLTGCAHSGVTVRTPEADNTQLPYDGVVRYLYPHATTSAPAIALYPQVLNK